MRKLAAVLALTAGTFVLAPPAPANALPTGCRAYIITPNNQEGGAAQCSGGTGHFRALVYCTSDPSAGWGTMYKATWVTPGKLSLRLCPTTQRYAAGVAYERANW